MALGFSILAILAITQILAITEIALTLNRATERTYLGLLAPYFDRPCLRLATPVASSVPRTT